jgi:hypothetical protein
MLSPRQAFEDNIRPAELLLRVYRLLENETVQTEGELVTSLRSLVGARGDEELMLIYNELFVGLIRERANFPRASLKKSALSNLLRQSIVGACTALETYLPSLLGTHLPTVIEVKGRDFFPSDPDLAESFKDLAFSLSDTLRLLGDPNAPLFIANKILGYSSFRYLAGSKGVHSVASLLSIKNPWLQIAEHLGQEEVNMNLSPDDDKQPFNQLKKIIDDTTNRRNDIVHRADRPRKKNVSEQQEITYAWSTLAVNTVMHVCLALDELVTNRMAELKVEHAEVAAPN